MMNYIIILLASILGCSKQNIITDQTKAIDAAIVNALNEDAFIATLEGKNVEELNEVDERGRTVTHYAAERGYARAITYLRSQNINHYNIVDNNDSMPIKLAATGWHIETMSALYKKVPDTHIPIDINHSFLGALLDNLNLSSAYRGDASRVVADQLISDILVDYVMALKDINPTAAVEYIYSGLVLGCQLPLPETKEWMIKLLWAYNLYPTALQVQSGKTPLHLFAVFADHTFLGKCIEGRMDVNSAYISSNIEKRPIWLLAAKSPHMPSDEDMVASAKALIEAGADVNYNNATCESVLVNAIHAGKIALAAFLLDHGGHLAGIDINQLLAVLCDKITDKTVGIEELVSKIVDRKDCKGAFTMKLAVWACKVNHLPIFVSTFTKLKPEIQKQLIIRLASCASVDVWTVIQKDQTIDQETLMTSLGRALSFKNRELSLHLAQHPQVNLNDPITQTASIMPFNLGVIHFPDDRELLGHLVPTDMPDTLGEEESLKDHPDAQRTIANLIGGMNLADDADRHLAVGMARATAIGSAHHPLTYALAFRSGAGILALAQKFNWWDILNTGDDQILVCKTGESQKIVSYRVKSRTSILDLVLDRFGESFVEDNISTWSVDKKTAKILINHMGNANALFSMLDMEYFNIAKYLLKSKIRLLPNIKDRKRRQSVLDLANELGDQELIGLLLDQGAKTYQEMHESKQQHAMAVASSSSGETKDSSSDEETEKEKSIYELVRNNDSDRLKLFLESKKDEIGSIIDSRDATGDTALYIAAVEKKHSGWVNALLRCGASVDTIIDGHTVLYYAALAGNIKILKSLVADDRHKLLLTKDIASLQKRSISADVARLLQLTIEEDETGPAEPVVEEVAEGPAIKGAIVHQDILELYNELKDRVERKLSRGKVGDDVKCIGGGLWQVRVGLARFWYVKQEGRNYILHGIAEKRTQTVPAEIAIARRIKDSM